MYGAILPLTYSVVICLFKKWRQGNVFKPKKITINSR